MGCWSIWTVDVLFLFVLTLCGCNEDQTRQPCLYLQTPVLLDDTVLSATSDRVLPEKLKAMKQNSRVCLPAPCEKLEAYSGFIPVDNESDSSYLFFLHIKSQSEQPKKRLLLWTQGGPWKSSLYSQFLENGPLGINAMGKLYYRDHSLIKDFDVIYLDQPVGSGYSFDGNGRYPATLDEASEQVMTFLKRFLRIFSEYHRPDLYIAGESYGARSAAGVAYKVLKKAKQINVKLKGIMLGVGFVFPLLEIIDSTNYLYYSGLLNDFGRKTLAGWFDMIRGLVTKGLYSQAAEELGKTVLNMAPAGTQTIFQLLTGFQHHGSIARPQEPEEARQYMDYANSPEFKKIIHVNISRILDGSRPELTKQLGSGDFFVDIKRKLEFLLDSTAVLFYTAQYDAVFPEVNIEQCFKKLRWRGSEQFSNARRNKWYREENPSLALLGYERVVGTLQYSNVLWGGHDISLDRSLPVSELYSRFLRLVRENKLKWTDEPS
ncbi:probable serine carboxypeptidase CPVL [Dermacentor albipictus]|uniref:probable serine carboxypeptidase CPVL n=1 Tax=Dermacentor albipictus TaxID=60249 RepID=UPI0038FC81B8